MHKTGPGLEPALAGVMDGLGAASLLTLPVRASGGGHVGVLMGPSPEPRTFSPEKRRFTLYAQLAGLAIERGRWVESARAPPRCKPGPRRSRPSCCASPASRR